MKKAILFLVLYLFALSLPAFANWDQEQANEQASAQRYQDLTESNSSRISERYERAMAEAHRE